MKKVIIGVFALLMATACSAHYVTATCWQNGRFTFNASSFPIGKTCTIKVTTGGTTWDSTFTITKTSFQFKVPQPVQGTIRKVNVKVSDGFNENYWTTSNKCLTLPLVFTDFSAERISSHEVLITAVVEDVYNVDHIDFMVSIDATVFKVVATIKPDNISDRKTYTAIIDLNNKK